MDLKELKKHRKLFSSEKSERKEALDILIQTLLDQLCPETRKLVVHRFPDDDCWLSLWIAKRFIPKTANAELLFVNAGESLPNSEEDPTVLHFDTGGGEYDQHGKGGKSASAVLLAEKLGLSEDPGLKSLLEMVVAVDNIQTQPLPPTSIHFAIEGYPRQPDFRNADGTINWQKVEERIFELFDIVYNQETARARSRENLKRWAEWTTLSNGLRVCSLLGHPECREAAFEAGAQVVFWTQPRGKQFYTGIQSNRRYPVFLDNLVAALRRQEAKIRGRRQDSEKDLRAIGRGFLGVWYLHDSKHLILNGSRSWKLDKEEFTKMTPHQILEIGYNVLSTIPQEIVSRWK